MNTMNDVSDSKQMSAVSGVICLILCFLALGLNIAQAVPAFPGAEGYGAVATGGRGGVVYEVTTLNPTGTGSLGAAIGASGARTVVFRVAGTITGNFNISNGNITIAGQTAPGDGICIKGTFGVSADNVIVRYIRVRNDTSVNPESDTIGGRGHQNIIIDHVSASWSGDEVMSFYQNTNVTIQWCMVTEACAKFIDGVNTGHQFGGIWGNNYGTYHHNLIAHNVSRNPRWASGCRYNDYRNNVIYNWDYNSCYGGELYGDATWNFTMVNMIANYYKYGPATDSGVRDRIAEPSARSSTDKGSWYVTGNYVNGYPAVTTNNWLGMDGSNYIALSAPWSAMAISQQTPAAAYAAVLAHVGCSKPNRDSVDTRIINEVSTGTATYGTNGIINRPSDVGGWPTLASGTPPADNDHDGMADDWEILHGLNPSNAADRNYYTLSADYTNLEVYLDSLANPDSTPPTPNPMTWATTPYGANETSVTMVATTATDDSGVEYFFACTAGGGHDSGWQDSPVYTDTGLTLGMTYSYQVKARDKSASQNETGWSGVASAAPVPDTTAPIPDPMTWASAPAATGIDTIIMTATTATDASAVEYYFANITDSNHDSGWQDSTSYTDTGLTNNTIYSYSVKARDKSTGQNETGWSDEAQATTMRYECLGPVENDFNGDCKTDFMDYAAFAGDWGAESGTAVNLVNNGDFTTSISSWTLADVSGATGVMTAAFDGVVGNPAGSALMSADTTVFTNNHRFYQCVPVTVGHQYVLTGEWSGDIRGLVTDGSGGTLRNWAEIWVGFETDTTPANWTSMAIMYKKAYGAGLQNTTTGFWDWESITDSPNGTTPPAGGIFTATAQYMVVAFNLGGRAGSGSTYINADNISVVETGGTPCPEMDLSGDCALDWLDVRVFAESWLNCNRNPAGECLY